jgi:hypothetical protein
MEELVAMDTTGVLLSQGRTELNIREGRWLTASGRQMVNKGLLTELDSLIKEKKALRPLSPEESRRILTATPDRCLDPRVVYTLKDEGTADERVKTRVTVRGYKDPDLLRLVREGRTASPTLSADGKRVLLQLIASLKFKLQVGDVHGAFLESDPLDRPEGPLYLKQPKEGFPGLEPGQILEVVLPLYGLNDAPQRWFRKLSTVLKKLGWKQSIIDPCLWILRDPDVSKAVDRPQEARMEAIYY